MLNENIRNVHVLSIQACLLRLQCVISKLFLSHSHTVLDNFNLFLVIIRYS